MIACTLSLIAMAAQAPAPATEVAWPESGSLAVVCPLNHDTRIALPESLRRLRTFGPDRQAIAVTVERTSPTALIVVRPGRHPARCALEFHGSTRVLLLEITTADVGGDNDLRITTASAAATVASPAPPTPMPTPTASPTPERVANTPRPSPNAEADALVTDLPWANAVSIGRQAGLPGQPPLILEDALRTEKWIWYRFRLVGGASEEVAGIEWEHGPLTGYIETQEGADRRILVRVPRKLVTRRTRLVLRLASGPVYRVPPFPATLGGLFGRLFH